MVLEVVVDVITAAFTPVPILGTKRDVHLEICISDSRVDVVVPPAIVVAAVIAGVFVVNDAVVVVVVTTIDVVAKKDRVERGRWRI